MTNLNTEQQRAVNTVYGPVLVLAGPGSGKTHTLTERIRHMIEEVRISPDEILVITFSKKAAVEMQERFLRLTKGKCYKVYFGTFHAIFYSILKNSSLIDKGKVLTQKDKLKNVKRAFYNLKLTQKDEASYLEIIDNISAYKNSDEKKLFISEKFDEDKGELFVKIYNEYIRLCRKDNMIDFDDMLYMCRDLLRSRAEIRKMYQGIYKYILIDEFQDINLVQYEVLDMLSGKNNNIFAVGDDDQSIYGFRGAKPELMKKFMNRKGCEIIDLKNNYRSSKAVIESAHKLIKHNISRINKEQIPCKSNYEYGNVTVVTLGNAIKEAEFVCEKIKELINDGEIASNIAVIFRTERCIEVLKEKMNLNGILYTTNISSDSFYESEWAKDIVAYLRAATNNRSVDVMGRIINKPERNLDRDDINSDMANPENYEKLLKELNRISNMSSFAAVNYIYKRIGYESYIYKRLSSKGYSNEKIKELLDQILEKAKLYENINDWLFFIDSVYEANNMDNLESRVNLLTAHSSKGLEFNTVFIVGLQEGIFPHDKALTKENIEEERRLLYVAMTRAKTDLFVVGRGEYKYGKRISRFISELEEK